MTEKLVEGKKYVVYERIRRGESERAGEHARRESSLGDSPPMADSAPGVGSGSSETEPNKRQKPPKVFKTISQYFKRLTKQFFCIPRTWRQGAVFVGNWFIGLAVIGMVVFYLPLWWVEFRYEAKVQAEQGTFGELLQKNVTHRLISSPDPYFSIVIPKIEARAKILPNIDASSSREYSVALREGVAHAKGTVFPGMAGTIFLFAHSTDAPWNIIRHNAVFYLLRELEPGDQVIVFFQGIRYDYRVTDKKVVPSTETGFFGQREEELLVLQTCHPPGTTREALLVFARRERRESGD